jgi:hypothetical protein
VCGKFVELLSMYMRWITWYNKIRYPIPCGLCHVRIDCFGCSFKVPKIDRLDVDFVIISGNVSETGI